MKYKIERLFKRKEFHDLCFDDVTEPKRIQLEKIINYIKINNRRIGDSIDLLYNMVKYNNNDIYKSYVTLKEKKIPKNSKEWHRVVYGNLEMYYAHVNKAIRNLPNRTEYWIDRGYSNEEAQKKALETNRELNKKESERRRGNIGTWSAWSKEYWINRGYSEDEASKEISTLQTRDLNYFIYKYGIGDGKTLYDEMITKRAKAWESKSIKEKLRINKSKGRSFEQLKNTYGESKAKKILESRLCYNNNTSKIANEMFRLLDINANIKESMHGGKGIERFIYLDDAIIFVDYFYNGKIIEFNGDYWHANPIYYNSNDIINKKNALEIWNNDKKRLDKITKLGYDVLVIWENQYRNNPDQTLDECKTFLEKEK